LADANVPLTGEPPLPLVPPPLPAFDELPPVVAVEPPVPGEVLPPEPALLELPAFPLGTFDSGGFELEQAYERNANALTSAKQDVVHRLKVMLKPFFESRIVSVTE
jgi:hypothetical protein